MIHFDSSFLVDLLRERHRGEPGLAHAFLDGLPAEEPAGVSVHAVCELHVGVALSSDPEAEGQRVTHLLSTLSVATPDDSFPPTYGRLLAKLRGDGIAVATMDLLIATAAVCASAPLVTGNPRHFRPVPDLTVLTYRDDAGGG